MATKLTEHFTLEELTASNKAVALKIDNTPSTVIQQNLLRLAMLLESIRNLLGKPIKVSSAYRCPALNKAVGGSRASAHVLGLAADINVTGMTPRQVAKAIVKAGVETDQTILENVSVQHPDGSWVHVGLSEGTPRKQVLTMKAGKYFTGLC